MSDLPPHEWLDRPEQLAALGEALKAVPWLALDCEANSMFVYRERLCLLQLNLAGRLVVVDPLPLLVAEGWDGSAPSKSLEALRPGLERTDRRLWLHGGEYDCSLLRRDFGINLGGVWDTQQAASMLGWEQSGYGAVVAKTLDIHLAKAHAQEDWGRRPLATEAIRYALDDVIHLPKAGEILAAAVAKADIEEEHAIANAAVAATTSHIGFDPAAMWKVKGIRDVSRSNLGVFLALYTWRDGLARQADKPPGRLINNEVLLVLARHAPTSFQQLKLSGVHGRIMSAHGDELLALIKDAKSKPLNLPDVPRQREVAEHEEKLEDKLKDWRRAEAANRGVPLQVVLPAKALDHIKRHGASELSSVPQLGPKRIARYGAKLLDLCRI